MRRNRRILTGILPLALAGLAACDIPTSPPKWDTLWVAPGKSTTIGVGSVLPAGVSLASGGTAFQLDIAPSTVTQTLGQLCPPCSQAQGFVVPKPPFNASFGTTVSLPASVITANLQGGQVLVNMQHNFGFDPLRPSSATRGFVVVTARNGNTTLTRDTISGTATAWPTGSTITRTLPLSSATLSGPIDVTIQVFSPAGDPVRIDINQRLTVTSTPQQLRVSQAQVRISNQTVTGQPVELDLDNISQFIIDRTKGGALLLDITNPFAVTGNLTLTITAPGTTITKPLQLQTGTFTSRIALTESELRAILGKSGVRLNVTGAVSAPSSGATVRPNQSVSISSRLETTIGPKED